MKRLQLVLWLTLPLSLASCSSSSNIAFIEREAWGWLPDENAVYRKHTPERITIHHSGVVYEGKKPAAQKLRELQAWSRRERPWPDIPYHYLIDLQGKIYEGRPIEFVGDTNTNYDPTGHILISVMGNYEEQPFSAEQEQALLDLCAHFVRKYHIPPDLIKTHQDYVPSTLCPGKNILAVLRGGDFFPRLREMLGE